MKFKKISSLIFIGLGCLTIAACSTTKSHDAAGGAGDMAAADGAQTAGVGSDEGFGGRDGAGQQLASKRTFYFAFDRSDVRDEDKPAILANADFLVAHPNEHLTINGHTDPRGSREYNVALGERRANAVFNLLKSRGVNPSQVRIVSYGAQQLAVAGHTEEDYQLDRRANLVYTSN